MLGILVLYFMRQRINENENAGKNCVNTNAKWQVTLK